MIRLHGLGFLLLAAFTFAGCQRGFDPRFGRGEEYLGGFRPPGQQHGRAPHDDVSYWDGDAAQGPPSIRISLHEQRAYFYKGGELVGVSVISTGREGFDTPTGSFRILDKHKDHVSSIYGDYVDAVTGEVVQKDIDSRKDPKPRGAKYDGARMPYFMRFNGGVGMHEGFLPGYPASHGCIRMPGFMAERFFANVSVGTPVTVTP
jgi:hypothetical protein